MAYIYQADVWCDACGEAIRQQLTAEGKAPQDPDDERTYDSGDFPKYYDAEREESDSPENCADGKCGGTHTEGPNCYGTFLENQLTPEGYRYLKSMLDEHGETLPPPVKEWAEFYGFTYHKNQWTCPLDWINDYLNRKAQENDISELLEAAKSLASKLDSDTIQDIYQSDMDEDDFFKETGWYSPEMGD